MNYALIFFGLLINVLVIWYLMNKVEQEKLNRLRMLFLFLIILGTILITSLVWEYLAVGRWQFDLEIISWIFILFLIPSIFTGYLIEYCLKNGFSFGRTMSVIGLWFTVLMLLIMWFIPNVVIPNHFHDNVKGAIYIYDNKTGQENITVVLCNNGKTPLNDDIIIQLFHNASFNISIREKDGHNDLSMWWKNPIIRICPKGNLTLVEYSKPNFSITLDNKKFLYVNFTVKWDFSKNFTKPYYTIYIDKYKPYIARICGRPPIELLPNGMDWDMQPIFNQILKYEKNRWSDW